MAFPAAVNGAIHQEPDGELFEARGGRWWSKLQYTGTNYKGSNSPEYWLKVDALRPYSKPTDSIIAHFHMHHPVTEMIHFDISTAAGRYNWKDASKRGAFTGSLAFGTHTWGNYDSGGTFGFPRGMGPKMVWAEGAWGAKGNTPSMITVRLLKIAGPAIQLLWTMYYHSRDNHPVVVTGSGSIQLDLNAVTRIDLRADHTLIATSYWGVHG